MDVVNKLFGPGLFRLFLASAVVVYHLSRFAVGASAVFIFFILSGFWIFRMWTDRYAQTIAPYRVYLVSRFWRLLPAFVLVSLIARVLEGFPPNGGSISLHYFFSQVLILGYSTLSFKPIGPAWSLDIEMQFYLLAPLLIWLLSRIKPAIAIGGFAALAGISSYLWGAMLPSYLIFFMVGMVASQARWNPSRKIAMLSLGVTCGIVLAVAVSPFRGALFNGAHPGPYVIYNLPLNVLLGFATAPFAIFTTSQAANATDRMCADLSYIVYLLHWPILQWIKPAETGHRVLVTLALCIGVYYVSFLVWKFYDKPVNRLRAAWVDRRMATSPWQRGARLTRKFKQYSRPA